ncbi:uncharacterized protein [Amphiura filiformis]|uniref:uncharacterized protein n=1 Tax=Amphiura filiformis TaxID=82378 RepID=UPI003B220762
MFNTSTQSEGESIEQYVTKLRTLAEHCDYGDLEESLIRDRVVLGLRTVKLRERLLKKSDLTLQTAIEEINVYEATRKQMKKIEENSADKSIHAMKKFDTRRKSQTQYASTRRKPQSYDARRKFKSQFQKTEEGCTRCGRPQHKEGNKCPAMGKRCNKCGGMNHFYDQCRTKKSTGRVKQFEEVEEETDEYEDDYDEICACRSKKDEKQVYATMEIGSERRRRKFQIDTGASCNVMSFQDLDNESKSMIEPSNKDEELKMYNQSKMRPLGHTKLKVRNPANGKKYLMTVTVIKEPYKPIIGKKAAEYMGLVEIKYENIQLVEAANQILEEYTDVFDGLGHLPGQYKIQVDKTVPPVAQPPRRVPAALRKPLKDKLDELEQKGIISPIKKHTQWVSSVVIVHN